MGDDKITVYIKANPEFPITLYWGRKDPPEREYINVPATGEMAPVDARRLAHALLYAADRVEMKRSLMLRLER